MTRISPSIPEPLDVAAAVGTAPPAHGAPGGPPTPGSDRHTPAPGPRRESKRVAGIVIAILALGAVFLNVAIYRTARERLVHDRWGQLASYVEDRREDIRTALHQLERDAGFVAGQASIQAWAARAGAEGTPEGIPDEGRALVERELDRAAAELRFSAIRLLNAEGSVLAGTSGASGAGSSRDIELALRAIRSGRTVSAVGTIPGEPRPVLALAVPIRAPGQELNGTTALFHAGLHHVLQPVLRGAPAIGSGAGTYLVARMGKQGVILTPPPVGVPGSVGSPVRMADPGARAASIAARGVETSVEISDAAGEPAWGVTRFLPELGVAVVGQVGRAAVLKGMRETLSGLLVLDLGMVLLAGSVIWLWRRRYQAHLVERNLELTRAEGERIQAVFDNAFDAILTFDVQGRIRAANRAARSLFERTASQMEGEPVQRFLRVGGRAGAIESLPLETVSRSEALRADGSVIPVEFSLSCAGEGDARIYTAVLRDNSERVNAEERIQAFSEGLEITNRRLEEANAQLAEASRLKSEFLANTSHELRTPLNGMIGFLQLVLDRMCDSPEEEREFLEQALQCSRHLLGLINDVLDIAKIEAGKLALDIEPVDIDVIFGEVYTLAHVQAAQKGISLKFNAPPRGTAVVRGDFGKIKQILLNLVGNSLKFTDQGSITVRAIEHADLGYYMFEIEDTGIGIPLDRQKIIFDKFIQADMSTTRKYGGTGLGLAISRSLVELMGGIIGVQSEGAGKGTRMYFSLPVWRSEEAGLEDDDEEGEEADLQVAASLERIEGPAGGALILVVEDDGVFRKFISALLRGHGYRTVGANSAEGGWLLARRLRPAVVVLDYALSCAEGASLRSGWDLAERLTTDPRTRAIPIVFVTGFDLQLKDKLKTTAFTHPPEHLMKPVDGSALIAKIEELVGSRHDGVVRVLMADDDPSVSAYVRKVLPDSRFHIEVANNGEECLHILRTQPQGFDLLLLDLMMPDVSGYDVLRELSLTRPNADLPVLILTNFPDARNEEEKRLLEKGFVLDVIAKSSVHDNPMLLPHLIDWHLQVAVELGHPSSKPHEEDSAEEAERKAA